MKTNRYLAILILISLLINVGLGWYALDLSRQIDQQQSNYDTLNASNQVVKHYLFLLVKDDILIQSSTNLNISVYYLNNGTLEDTNKLKIIGALDQIQVSFHYFTWAAQNLGGEYVNMTNFIYAPKENMLDNLATVRDSVFYGNYTQNDIDYLQKVAICLSTVADNLLETAVGQYSITDIDAIVFAFYQVDSMLPTG